LNGNERDRKSLGKELLDFQTVAKARSIKNGDI